MKALYLNKQLNLIDTEPPKPKDNEALIKVLIAGICQTDIELVKGYMDFEGIIGHEFVGEILECPSKESWIGKRVVGEISIGCGSCSYCLQNLSRHCPTRSVIGIQNKAGVFAEQIALPVKNLHLVPDNISNNSAVFTEPLAAACEILEQIHINPADHVVIIGDGRLAHLIARVLILTGCELTLIGKHAEKMASFKTLRLNTYLNNTVPDHKYDIVVEASGSPSGMELALKITKPRGTIIIKSTYMEKTELNLAQIVIDEIKLLGSRCGKFEPAIRLLNKNLIEVEDLISQAYPIENYIKAFEQATTPNNIKTIFNL